LLKLYALPEKLERELLDFFDSVPRVGVPFEQKCYIPSAFREVMRLDEFLRITMSGKDDERRCQLIEKRIKQGRRSFDEKQSSRNCNASLIYDGATCVGVPLEMHTARFSTRKNSEGLRRRTQSGQELANLPAPFAYPSKPHVRRHGRRAIPDIAIPKLAP